MHKGYLRLIVMKNLKKQELSGYSLIKRIEEQTGFWKPSAGSIYPLLDNLNHMGLIISKEKGRQKLYHLSKKGEQYLLDHRQKVDVLMEGLADRIKVLTTLMDDEQTTYMLNLIMNFIKGDEIPFKAAQPQLMIFRNQLIEMDKKGLIDKHGDKVRDIMEKSTQELKKLK